MSSPYKGFISIDLMLSIVPIVLMLLFYVQYSVYYSARTIEVMERQTMFNKLVAVADYIVKIKANTIKDETGNPKAVYPNWLTDDSMDFDVEKIKQDAGLEKLSISFDKGEGICIYRIVVYGEEKEIRRLFVCGE
ncbi:MAG: hypothetical protein ACPL06_00055 [Candidatus Anstonellales archaeon]